MLLFESFHKLVDYLKSLRQSDNACAWTQAQTFQSLAPQTIEESYELTDAIERNDSEAIKSELGDLLYHIVFYAQIAEENNLFNIEDIAQNMLEKHERRLPKPEQRDQFDAAAVNAHWEKEKAKELAKQNSILEGIAKTIPALTRAIKLQNRAAKVGFDWPSALPVLDKIEEELNELKHEIQQSNDNEKIQEEYGDLLFVIANLARHLHLDPEMTLRQANEKFCQRFHFIEQQAKSENKPLSDMTLEEMEQLWRRSKQH